MRQTREDNDAAMSPVQRLSPLTTPHTRSKLREARGKAEPDRDEWDDWSLTRGLDRECCGDEWTSMGIPRAGLVPEPLLPANWTQEYEEEDAT